MRQFIKTQIATLLIITVNVMVFLSYGLSDFNTLTLLDLGANFAPFSLDTAYYRFISSIFLHGSAIHLLVNMYSLYSIGGQLENELGQFRFLLVYFFTGLIAGFSSAYFNLFTISVGASGAIFGLYGYTLANALIKEELKKKISVLINFILYMLVMFFIGKKLNFDNAGHLGGVITGLTLGLLAYKITLTKNLTLALGISIIMMLFLALPRYQVDYYNSYQYFIQSDEKIASVLSSSDNDQIFIEKLNGIKSIPDSVKMQFQEIEKLPVELSIDTTRIFNYLKLKKQEIAYFMICLSEERFIYIDSIEIINQKINQTETVKYNLFFQTDTDIKIASKPPSTTQKIEFYDENWFICEESDASYFRKGEVDSLGDWHGFIRDYFLNGDLQMKGKMFKGLQNGVFVYYNDNGGYSSAGRYGNGYRFGKWENFYRNGRLASEIRFTDNNDFIENMWDSIGSPIVINGEGIIESYFPTGQLQSRRVVKDGLNQGLFEGYHKDGSPHFKELFDQGELIRGVSFANNATHNYDLSTYIAYPSGGYDAFYDYVKSNNLLATDTIDGQVKIAFDIHKNGEKHNYRYMQRMGSPYDEYAKDLIINGPEWIPGMLRGYIPISSYGEVVIQY